MNARSSRHFLGAAFLATLLTAALALIFNFHATIPPEHSTAATVPPGLLLYPLVSLPLVHALLSR